MATCLRACSVQHSGSLPPPPPPDTSVLHYNRVFIMHSVKMQTLPRGGRLLTERWQWLCHRPFCRWISLEKRGWVPAGHLCLLGPEFHVFPPISLGDAVLACKSSLGTTARVLGFFCIESWIFAQGQPWTTILLPMASLVAGMTGPCHHTQWVRWGISLSRLVWTSIFLISAS
jgi:hypothetical protein